jgi:hypothetical protein
MEKITFEFEYNLPDEFLHQTDDLKLTAVGTYNGPEFLWVFVDKETGKLDYQSYYLYHDKHKEKQSIEHAKLKGGRRHLPVLVTAKENPIIASFFMNIDYDNLPKKQYTKDNTVYYSRPDPVPPIETYEVTEIYYDLDRKQWKNPLPWKTPHITAEMFDHARQSIIQGVEDDLKNSEISSELKTKLQQFLVELQAIPVKFNGCDPWTIPFPIDPRTEIAES